MNTVFKLTALGLMLTQPIIATAFVAGSQPQQRPAYAPKIQYYAKSPAWYAQALHGITQPYPPSLHFLENQGAWYIPFTRPGMTGAYDLRAWHVHR